MKIKKIVIFIVCLLFTNSCNSTLLCVPSAKKVKVEDVFLRQNYIPSYKINRKDRYCLFYEGWNYKSNLNNFNIDIIDNQVINSLSSYNIKIKKEELIHNINEENSKNIKNSIIKRENNNNYENCNYLISYYVVTSTNEKEICSSNLHIVIKIIDIKNGNDIALYSLIKGTYRLSQQEEFTKELMNKWWEFQNKSNKKKFEAMECNYIGCKTIKCKGDNCSISEIKEYK